NLLHRRIDSGLGGEEVGTPQEQFAGQSRRNFTGNPGQPRERFYRTRRIAAQQRLEDSLGTVDLTLVAEDGGLGPRDVGPTETDLEGGTVRRVTGLEFGVEDFQVGAQA